MRPRLDCTATAVQTGDARRSCALVRRSSHPSHHDGIADHNTQRCRSMIGDLAVEQLVGSADDPSPHPRRGLDAHGSGRASGKKAARLHCMLRPCFGFHMDLMVHLSSPRLLTLAVARKMAYSHTLAPPNT